MNLIDSCYNHQFHVTCLFLCFMFLFYVIITNTMAYWYDGAALAATRSPVIALFWCLIKFTTTTTTTFDYVGHQQLLDCVFNTNLPATIRRWLYNYVQNRRTKVHFWQKESRSRKVKAGGDLSPALFIYYLDDFPTPPPNIKLMTLPSTHLDLRWLT